MPQFEKSLIGIEKGLKGQHQRFIDYFSGFLGKSPMFKGEKTTDNKNMSDFERKISYKAVDSVENKQKTYGTREIRDDLKYLIKIVKEDELLRVDYAEITQAVLRVDKNREDVSDNLGDFLVATKIEYFNILKEFKKRVSTK